MQKMRKKIVTGLLYLGLLCSGILLCSKSPVYAAEAGQEGLPLQMPPAAVPQDNGAQSAEETPAAQQQPLPQDTEAVTPEGEAEETPIELEGFELLSTMMTARDEANVRSGPDTKYKSLGKLEVGQQVFVLGRLPGNWYQITYEGGNAFVSADYLAAPEVDEALVKEMQENIAENLAQVSEIDNQVAQMEGELAAAREEASQANQEAEAAKAELAAGRTEGNRKQGGTVNIAIVIAFLFAAVFIGGLLLVLKPEWFMKKGNETAEPMDEDEDDGLEEISLTDMDQDREKEQPGREPAQNSEEETDK